MSYPNNPSTSVMFTKHCMNKKDANVVATGLPSQKTRNKMSEKWKWRQGKENGT